jgi:hypothetical protein
MNCFLSSSCKAMWFWRTQFFIMMIHNSLKHAHGHQANKCYKLKKFFFKARIIEEACVDDLGNSMSCLKFQISVAK